MQHTVIKINLETRLSLNLIRKKKRNRFLEKKNKFISKKNLTFSTKLSGKSDQTFAIEAVNSIDAIAVVLASIRIAIVDICTTILISISKWTFTRVRC